MGAGCYRGAFAPPARRRWRRARAVSPGRTIGFLSALAAVIAAVGIGIGWIHSHVSGDTVYFTGLALLTLSIAVMGLLMHHRRLMGRAYAVRVAAIIAAMVVTGVVAGLVAFDSWEHITAYVYVAVAAIPLFWDAYQHDKEAHKQCPDCCESVKSGARVCRFCRHVFAARVA
jgi:hypothetical protein